MAIISNAMMKLLEFVVKLIFFSDNKLGYKEFYCFVTTFSKVDVKRRNKIYCLLKVCFNFVVVTCEL